MRNMFTKMFAVLTAVLMLLCMLPADIFAEGDIPIDETHFPDANFRNFVLNGYYDWDNEEQVLFDTDGSGALSPEEIAAVTDIDVSYMEIADLTGIEYFTALTELYCVVNQLTQLDVSNNTALTSLDCSSNQLTQLNVSNNTALEWLYCFGNQLTSLDLSANTNLEDYYFTCNNNKYRVSSDPFDLTALPGNFDISKASNRQGGTVEDSILIFDEGSETVTYTYDCGNGLSAEFKLILTEPGDYDGDGEVTTQDAIMTLRSALGLIPGEVPAAADINDDGVVNTQDAIMILRKAMGLI